MQSNRYPQIFQALIKPSNQNGFKLVHTSLNPFSRSISIGMTLRLSAKMSEEKTDIGLT